jgi:hypothetical protein
MGGKSTYLRQVAQLVLLAQAGSFVPAEEAALGVADRIFCRVGASDSWPRARSTFMVEMTETANILHHATAKSLVLLDEIGRGTSTFDGLSIAWAVVEQLHGRRGAPPHALRHALPRADRARRGAPGVVNWRMAVRERGTRWSSCTAWRRAPPTAPTGSTWRAWPACRRRWWRAPARSCSTWRRDAFGKGRVAAAGEEARTAQQGQFALFPAEAEDVGAAEVLAELRAADPAR